MEAVPPAREFYSNPIFPDIIESYLLWIHKSIPPTVEHLGRGGQNPLLLEAFRALGSADERKRWLAEQQRERERRRGK